MSEPVSEGLSKFGLPARLYTKIRKLLNSEPQRFHGICAYARVPPPVILYVHTLHSNLARMTELDGSSFGRWLTQSALARISTGLPPVSCALSSGSGLCTSICTLRAGLVAY